MSKKWKIRTFCVKKMKDRDIFHITFERFMSITQQTAWLSRLQRDTCKCKLEQKQGNFKEFQWLLQFKFYPLTYSLCTAFFFLVIRVPPHPMTPTPWPTHEQTKVHQLRIGAEYERETGFLAGICVRKFFWTILFSSCIFTL